MTPAAPLAEPDTILLIADARLDGLRGQTLAVGDEQLCIPTEPGPFPVPLAAARQLVAQAGWRLADPKQAFRLSGAPPVARIIGTPARTRDEHGRLASAMVASPSAAEMAARDRQQASQMCDVALVTAHLAAAQQASAPAEPEHVALPASEPTVVADPAPLGGGFDSDFSGSADFGGSSDPLD